MVFSIPTHTGRLAQCEDVLVASTSGARHQGSTVRPAEQRHRGTTLDRRRCRADTLKCQVTRQEREALQIRAEEEEEDEQGSFASGASRFGALVNTLLFGAASRIERGTSICVSCRGGGTILCPDCQATGIQGNASASRNSSSRLKGLMGTKSKEKEWVVSNRCKSCRGYGRRECPHCDGEGRRFSEWL